MTRETCALCNQGLRTFSLAADDLHFCCHGCHAVYQILATKNALENYQSHPLFLQALQGGLISNPVLLEQIKQNTPLTLHDDLEKMHVEILDMWCPSCSEVIKLMLLKEKGVKSCLVDYATDLAVIEYSPRYISKDRILEIIIKLGYQPMGLGEATQSALTFSQKLRFIVAAFCALNVMMFAYPLYATYFDQEDQGVGQLLAWMSLAVSTPVMTYCALPIIRRFWNSLQVGILGMEALVVLGVTAALSVSLYELGNGGTKVYFDSLTVIIAFVLLGKMIETKAKFSAKNSMKWLARSLPRRVRKKNAEGTFAFVPMKEVVCGDIIQILTGERVPLDGVVVGGEGFMDESSMTGESLPIEKGVGKHVMAGTLLQNGNLQVHVKNSFEESTVHQIITLIEKDIGRKSVYVRAADRIVAWFVPFVLALSLLTAIGCYLFSIVDPGQTVAETAFLRAITILLISCPCAIGIAAPLAEAHMLNGFAKLGAIVRNRACLPFIGRETTFVFDKTGTITEGYFHLLEGLELLTSYQKGILKGLTSHSIHPIAQAISRSISESSHELFRVHEQAGRGLSGLVDDQHYYVGSDLFISQQGINVPQHESKCKLTQVYFADSQQVLAELTLGDRIREDAVEVLSALSELKTLLLSGDAQQPVEAAAQQCGFKSWLWRQSPLEKRECIQQLREKGEIVAMLGDGINDAPALSGVHVGISIVSAADVSIQVSDILLTTDRLSVIPKMRVLARRGQKIIKQNLFWAFFYNSIGLGLAAFGLMTPLYSAVAMVASSLMVLLNAQRIK